jgi:SAM-dependent methyltransferase
MRALPRVLCSHRPRVAASRRSGAALRRVERSVNSVVCCRGTHQIAAVRGPRVHEERLEIGDAFGETLKQCWAGGAEAGVAFEQVERSDGFLASSDASRYFDDAVEWTSPSSPFATKLRGRVLDIGAGAGRLALGLQSLGHDVVALDVSAGALEVCAARGVREVFHGSVTDLAATAPKPFDTFVLAGNNLGLLGGREAAPAFLSALSTLAAPGARVIGETADPYAATDPVHLGYHELNRASGRLGGQLRIRIRHRLLSSEWFDYLLCTPDELRAIVEPTPWRLEDAHLRSSDDEPSPSAAWLAVLRAV